MAAAAVDRPVGALGGLVYGADPTEYPVPTPEEGFCLAPKVGPLRRVDRPKGMPLPAGPTVTPMRPSAGPSPVPMPPPSPVKTPKAAAYDPSVPGALPPQQLGRPLPVPPAAPQGEQRGLPDAHQLFHCGPRQIFWSSRVPVPEENNGIVINAEFRTKPEQVGVEVFHHDDGIRNLYWRHCGQLLPRVAAPNVEGMTQWLHHHAVYDGALDVKGLRKQELRGAPPKERLAPDYFSLNASRRDDGLWKTGVEASEKLRREVLDEAGMREFFADHDKVSFDR